jgi:hypothetical protein
MKEISRMFVVLRIFVGTLGPKPGQDRSLAMLLESTDLPSDDWRVANQRTNRVGAGKAKTDEIRRAKKDGGITAWRCLRSDSARRSLSCSVTPFASPSDAQSSLPDLTSRLVRKPFSKLNVYGQRLIEGEEVPGLSGTMVYEEQFTGPDGHGGTRIVAGAIGKVLFALDFSSLGDLWPWDDVVSMAAAQRDKIQRGHLDPTSASGRRPQPS